MQLFVCFSALRRFRKPLQTRLVLYKEYILLKEYASRFRKSESPSIKFGTVGIQSIVQGVFDMSVVEYALKEFSMCAGFLATEEPSPESVQYLLHLEPVNASLEGSANWKSRVSLCRRCSIALWISLPYLSLIWCYFPICVSVNRSTCLTIYIYISISIYSL